MEQNVLSKKENFNAVDVAKFIFSFFVISIHTCYNFFENSIANTVVNSVIIRIAVPFFFVASGFFFFRDIVFENGRIKKCSENRTKLFKFLKRIFLLYLIWAVIYFAFEAFTYVASGLPLASLCKTCALSFFLNGYVGHFWYLLFMMYAIIILYFLLRLLRVDVVGVIVVIIFIIFLYGYTYQSALGVKIFSNIVSPLMQIEINTLNSYLLFYPIYNAMGFLFAGFLCTHLRDKISKKLSGILAFISLVLSITENILLNIFSTRDWFSYTFFLLPLAIFGFIFLSKIKLNGKPEIFAFFRNGSSFIYCSHYLVLIIFNFFTDRQFINKPILFVIISALTLVLTLIIVPLSRKLKFLRKLY